MPLGTGKGATAAYDGDPSSSFVVCVEGRPRLLVDVGPGVMLSYQRHVGKDLPDDIYITHNHSDHSGELPVILAVEMKQRSKKLRVLSATEVQSRLQNHRMHELYSIGKPLDAFAEWIALREGEVHDIDELFRMEIIRGLHAEEEYGFLLFVKGNATPVLGFSGDSGYLVSLYSRLSAASTIVVDARTKSSAEHASFDEVAAWARGLTGDKTVYVTGYGRPDEAPSNLPHLRAGSAITL